MARRPASVGMAVAPAELAEDQREPVVVLEGGRGRSVAPGLQEPPDPRRHEPDLPVADAGEGEHRRAHYPGPEPGEGDTDREAGHRPQAPRGHEHVVGLGHRTRPDLVGELETRRHEAQVAQGRGAARRDHVGEAAVGPGLPGHHAAEMQEAPRARGARGRGPGPRSGGTVRPAVLVDGARYEHGQGPDPRLPAEDRRGQGVMAPHHPEGEDRPSAPALRVPQEETRASGACSPRRRGGSGRPA